MKRILLSVAVASVLVFTGCANKNSEFINKVNELPAWTKHSSEFKAVGSARYVGQSFDMLKQSAELEAKANLAQKIESHVETLMKSYNGVTNKTDNSTFESDILKVSKSVAAITLRNIKVTNSYIAKDGEYFVEVEISSNGLDSVLSEVKKNSVIAFKDLKKEVDNIKQIKTPAFDINASN